MEIGEMACSSPAWCSHGVTLTFQYDLMLIIKHACADDKDTEVCIANRFWCLTPTILQATSLDWLDWIVGV